MNNDRSTAGYRRAMNVGQWNVSRDIRQVVKDRPPTVLEIVAPTVLALVAIAVMWVLG
jgi:ABC-type transport system involved in Fe-S cluster assembly fused permease/ATPase subunit